MLPASLRDLLLRGLGEIVRCNGELLAQAARPQYLSRYDDDVVLGGISLKLAQIDLGPILFGLFQS